MIYISYLSTLILLEDQKLVYNNNNNYYYYLNVNLYSAVCTRSTSRVLN